MSFSINTNVGRWILPQIKKLHSYVIQIVLVHTDVRVRFAPSPTGHLHIGGARTALYNYLYAKSHGGKLILRIEDTNQEKTIPNISNEIENDLSWLKIPPDESPTLGGDYGPYKQSDRNDLYIKQANILLNKGHAYKCFCSPERLQQIKTINYDNHCRSLSTDEVKANDEKGMQFCIRFKLEPNSIEYDDLVYGKRIARPHLIGDSVIVKRSGYATFYLASVVDDHLMEISHVFRGVEWKAYANLFLSLYRAFEWPTPRYGHLPQLLNANRTKLSKRQESVSISELRKMGYSPEVIHNAATSSGRGFQKQNNMELFSMSDMINKFNVEILSTYSAPWEFKKLNTLSKIEFQSELSSESGKTSIITYLRSLVSSTYHKRLQMDLCDKYLSSVLELYKERVCNVTELSFSKYSFLWTREIEINHEHMATFDQQLIGNVISGIQAVISKQSTDHFGAEEIGVGLAEIREHLDVKIDVFLKILRLSICGNFTGGAPMKEIISILGKSEVLNRLENFKF